MRTSRLRVLGACVVLSLATACGSDQETATGASGVATESVQPPCPTINRSTIGLAMVDLAVYYESVDEMAEDTVVIGRVVAAHDGKVPYAGDHHESSDELRRIVTIDVQQHLTGDQNLRTFSVQTMGWTTRGGQRKPLTIDGQPWLEVGTEVLVAVKRWPPHGNYGFAGEGGVQTFCGGRILPVPGVPGAVSQILVGMSKGAVVRLFAQASAA